jgi:hypothetical protein
MRLRSEIWVKAYIRRCAAAGVAAAVARHGDDDAGAIYIRVNRLDGTSLLFGPSPAGLGLSAEDRRWMPHLTASGNPDQAVESYLAREAAFDPDLWIVEIEARDGAHQLDGWLLEDGRAPPHRSDV